MRFRSKKSRPYDPREPIYGNLGKLFPIILIGRLVEEGHWVFDDGIKLENGDYAEIHLDYSLQN